MGTQSSYYARASSAIRKITTPTTFADVLRTMKARGIPEDVARAVIWNEIDSGRLHLDTKMMRVIATGE